MVGSGQYVVYSVTTVYSVVEVVVGFSIVHGQSVMVNVVGSVTV